MAAAVHAPGPRAWDVAGGAAPGFAISDAASPLTPFFGPPSKVSFGPQDRMPHETWNLSEFADLPGQTLGPSPFMAVTIEALIVEFDEWPTRYLMPWVHTDRINVDWSVWRFDHTLADLEPEQAPPRYISSEREHHTARLVRRGLAFILEHGFWDTPAGQYAYAMNLKVLQSACHETVQQAVLHALLSEGKSWDRAWNAKYGTPARDMRSVFESINWGIAIVNKRELGWYVLDGQLSKYLASEHVTPDVWIVPPKMRVFASMVPNAETEYYRKGPGSQAMLANGEDSFTTFRGRKVFETRDVDIDVQDEATNALRRNKALGDWYLMANHFGAKAGTYSSDAAGVRIFNMDVDDFSAVSLSDALAACARFGSDGNLHPAHDDLAADWYTRRDDIAGEDGTSAPPLDMFLTDDGGSVRPIKYFGEMAPEHWTNEQANETAKALVGIVGEDEEAEKLAAKIARASEDSFADVFAAVTAGINAANTNRAGQSGYDSAVAQDISSNTRVLNGYIGGQADTNTFIRVAREALRVMGATAAPAVFGTSPDALLAFGRHLLGVWRPEMRLQDGGGAAGLAAGLDAYFEDRRSTEYNTIKDWFDKYLAPAYWEDVNPGRTVPASASAYDQFAGTYATRASAGVRRGIVGLYRSGATQWPGTVGGCKAIIEGWAVAAPIGDPITTGAINSGFVYPGSWYRANAAALAASPMLPPAPGLPTAGLSTADAIAAYAQAPLGTVYDTARAAAGWVAEDGDTMDEEGFAPAGARFIGRDGAPVPGMDYSAFPGATNMRLFGGGVGAGDSVTLCNRFEQLSKSGMRVNERIGLMAALFAPATRGTLEHWIAVNAPLPIAFLLERPFRRYQFGAGILAKGGLGLGASLYGRVNFQFADNVLTKTHVGHLSFYHRAVVRGPNQYVIADCMFLTGYTGGENVEFFTDRSQFDADEGACADGCSASMFSFAVPATTRRSSLPNPHDLTGRWHPNMAQGWRRSSAEARVSGHHPSARYYNLVWDFGTLRRNFDNVREEDGSWSEPDRMPNTIVYEGMGWYTDPAAPHKQRYSINSDPLGPNVYRGCRAARTGHAEFFQEQHYAKHYQPF